MSRALINTLRRTSQTPQTPFLKFSPPSITQSRSPLPIAPARWSSHSPLGASVTNARKPVTINTIQSLYRKNEPITVITAHDFPSAHVADHAGMDIILVGDSLAMVALGMDDTSEVLMDEMLLHCKSVARATKGAFTV
jgi:3-methyl-2-oxobutanoate hydroxymethyltransferase